MPPSSPYRLPPAFRRLAWSNLAAQSAEQIGLAAAPIVAVVALGADEGRAGLLQVAQTLPFVLFAIPIGLVADRLPRPAIMAVAELVRALSLLGILALAATAQLTYAALACLGFLGACGTVAFSVAAPALVPSLVPSEALPAANGRIELARTTAFAAGPALGGALTGWAGGAWAFGLAAGLSLVAMVLLLRIREGARAAAPRRNPWLDLTEGATFVFRHPLLRPLFTTQIVFNTAFFVLMAVYVPYALRQLALSEAGVGGTLASYGAGLILGSLAAARIMGRLRFGLVVAIGPVTGFVGSVVMALTIWWPRGEIAALGWFLLGAGPIIWVVSTTTLRQLVTPSGLLGRVSAINITSYGARPLGAGIGALVGTVYGAETCLLVAAGLFLVQAAMIVSSAAFRLQGKPQPVA